MTHCYQVRGKGIDTMIILKCQKDYMLYKVEDCVGKQKHTTDVPWDIRWGMFPVLAVHTWF